jgi:hypothetical protein
MKKDCLQEGEKQIDEQNNNEKQKKNMIKQTANQKAILQRKLLNVLVNIVINRKM